MSKVIQVLEAMAQLSNADVAQLVAQEDITAKQAEAIINKDVTSLERQLDVCPDIVCFLLPAEDEEKETESEDDETDIKSIVNG
jgi:hypothetical protein